MHIVCTDGMTVQCDSFRAIDSGVLLFTKDDEEREDAIGFVPMRSLQYVLPADAFAQQGTPPTQAHHQTQHQQQQQFQHGQPPEGNVSPR